MCAHMQWDSNELLGGDWTKGPQGTGETLWEFGFLGDSTLEGPELADSWEFPDDTTIIYHLHHGAHFQNKPPANGRELTAADVVWNMEMQFNWPGLWQTTAYPPNQPAKVNGQVLPGDPRRPTSFTALDKYTVQVKVPAASQALMFLEIGDNAYTNPPECWTGPNAPGMDTWQKCVGTGQYMMTTFVPGSIQVYTKNPNYFETDPLYPGNQWPYIDSVRILNIPDLSTQQAAFRTAKIDMLTVSTATDAQLLLQQRPELQYVKAVLTRNVVAGRQDKPNLPYQNILVRQAMNLAVDKQAILTGYYNNQAVMLGYPYPSTQSWAKFYTPLDQMPTAPQYPGSQCTVPELFGYNVDKAKDLLKQAGYPNGFKATCVVSNSGTNIDDVSIIKDYLSKVGIDITLQPVDPATFSSTQTNKNWDSMFYGSASGIWAPHEQLTTKTGMRENVSCQSDPYYAKVGTIIAADLVKDPATYFNTMKAEGVYELESAWGIWEPIPYSYRMWWPWVDNYYGINWTGWANQVDWYKGIWIDSAMKKSMGY